MAGGGKPTSSCSGSLTAFQYHIFHSSPDMRFIQEIFLLALCLVFAKAQVQSGAQAPSLIFYIEHSLDRGVTYKPRTTAQIVPKGDGRFGLSFDDNNSISGSDLEEFKDLLKTNDLYSIRIKSHAQEEYAIASIPAVS